MPQVILLAFKPRRFWLGVRVGASFDDVGYSRPKLPANLAQARLSALVLHGIVQ